jgi:hypothetical protein
MADKETCEVGSTVAPLAIGSYNCHGSIGYLRNLGCIRHGYHGSMITRLRCYLGWHGCLGYHGYDVYIGVYDLWDAATRMAETPSWSDEVARLAWVRKG